MASFRGELLLHLNRRSDESFGSQLKRQLRERIRAGSLRGGLRLPSTRALADQLGISRPVVVDVYEQLAAEGYLQTRQGARTSVAEVGTVGRGRDIAPPRREAAIRYDLRPAIPDLALFPRKSWLKSMRVALGQMPNEALGYEGRYGTEWLRGVLAEYLGRVRGVVAEPDQIVVTSGFAEARALVCAALRTRGVSRLAVEDPSYSNWQSVDQAGLTRIPVPVDSDGVDVDRLESSAAQAVFVTPAHQFPTGVVLGKERRRKLVAWLRQRPNRFAIEDDYDAEFRYDHAPTGALQGLVRDKVLYAGTVSKTLAPGLRLGWLVVPRDLVDSVQLEQRRWSEGCPRIDQNTLANFIESGGYDQQLRRMRRIYRRRREVLIEALGRRLPEAYVTGIAAGLHATVQLPAGIDEDGICAAIARRGVAADMMHKYRIASKGLPTLLLGYGRASESALRTGVRILAQAVADGRRLGDAQQRRKS